MRRVKGICIGVTGVLAMAWTRARGESLGAGMPWSIELIFGLRMSLTYRARAAARNCRPQLVLLVGHVFELKTSLVAPAIKKANEETVHR